LDSPHFEIGFMSVLAKFAKQGSNSPLSSMVYSIYLIELPKFNTRKAAPLLAAPLCGANRKSQCGCSQGSDNFIHRAAFHGFETQRAACYGLTMCISSHRAATTRRSNRAHNRLHCSAASQPTPL
jgi:hypothetical protein